MMAIEGKRREKHNKKRQCVVVESFIFEWRSVDSGTSQ
jgi:hypothetical protein